MSQPDERAFPPLLHRLVLTAARFQRGMTLGSRAVILDGADRVLLVRQSYTRGWGLPGGGVERGETLRDALVRELREEANVELTGEPVLHGVFCSAHISKRDHVAVYVVRDFRQTAPRAPDWEIVACDFHPVRALPEATTRGTAERIAEVIEGRAPAAFW